MNAVAVIPAGGTGSRFGGPKQFLTVAGLPVIVHTLRAFEKASQVERCVVVLPESELHRLDAKAMDQFNLQKVSQVVPGGSTRQDSVGRGLEAISETPDFVLIHDAARCLITPELIEKTLEACKGWDGAIAATPVHDTLKRVSENRIENTLDRTGLWAMQTPQVFRFPMIRDHYRQAREENFSATDDAAIAEHYGAKVRVSQGSTRNFKVTFPEDLKLAEELLTSEVKKS